jgi:hypothetical protein
MFRTYVESVSSIPVFRAANVFMLQVFYLDVAYVITHMLQLYVLDVLSVSDVCCVKCFMLHVFRIIRRVRGRGRSDGGTARVSWNGGAASRWRIDVARGVLGPLVGVRQGRVCG